MVVKANDIQEGEFRGVSSALLFAGKESVVTKKNYKAGDNVPGQKHLYEKSGYVLSGIYILRLDEVDEILTKGDFYSIPANVEHSLEIIESGEVIELFAPPRTSSLLSY
jgi:quercetin dioxygenase-like cupin family protein